MGPRRAALDSEFNRRAVWRRDQHWRANHQSLRAERADAPILGTKESDQIGAETYWPWGISVADLNADGYEDVFVSAGMGYPLRYAVNSILSGYLSQSSMPLYFGLDAASKIDRIDVHWPSGKRQVLTEGIPTNTLLTITEERWGIPPTLNLNQGSYD